MGINQEGKGPTRPFHRDFPCKKLYKYLVICEGYLPLRVGDSDLRFADAVFLCVRSIFTSLKRPFMCVNFCVRVWISLL